MGESVEEVSVMVSLMVFREFAVIGFRQTKAPVTIRLIEMKDALIAYSLHSETPAQPTLRQYRLAHPGRPSE